MERLTIYVDIDATICSTTGTDYLNAIPIHNAIDKVNKLFDGGHIVVMFTARGSLTGKDYRDMTQTQLGAWGVKYSSLKFGKPAWDVMIDDKAINAAAWRCLP